MATALDTALRLGRAAAESRRRSSAAVMRKTGDTEIDPVTGYGVPEWATVGTISFRLDTGGSSDGGSRGVMVGGITYEDATGAGNLPFNADDLLSLPLQDDDLLDVTGETTGTWRVVAAVQYDQKTARRIPIAEAQTPEEWA